MEVTTNLATRQPPIVRYQAHQGLKPTLLAKWRCQHGQIGPGPHRITRNPAREKGLSRKADDVEPPATPAPAASPPAHGYK